MEANQELECLQGIMHNLADMKGLSRSQRSQIAAWISSAIASGFHIKTEDALKEATWLFSGF